MPSNQRDTSTMASKARTSGRVDLAIPSWNASSRTRGAAVESLFLDRGRERWPGRLVSAVWRTSPELLNDALFDAVLDLKRRGEWNEHDFVNWKAMAKASPGRCLRMLEAKIGAT